MNYDEILCRFYVKGSKDSNERKRAESIGIKAYKMGRNKFINPIFIPCYNWIWKMIFPKYSKEDYLDDNKLYTRIFWKVCSFVSKICVLLCGGYWFKQKRKICLNYDFTFKPCTEEEKKRDPLCTHIVDDMISIKEFGE